MDIPNNQTEETPLRSRKAFTLLEMLIVIGVILLLVTIAVAAYTKIVNAMAYKATGTAMENCRSITGEYEKMQPLTGMGFLPDGASDDHFPYLGGQNVTSSGLPAIPNNTTKNQPINDPNNSASYAGNTQDLHFRYPNSQIESGPPVGYDYVPAANAQTNAVYKTACVMMYFMRVPAISQQLANLPAKSFLTTPVPNMPTGAPIALYVRAGAVANVKPAPILLDGWGNPIIFVPASGMIVTLKGGTLPSSTTGPPQYLVRTSGITPYNPASIPLVGANDRPFWASAGSDGIFDTGDDNVYSFKQ